MEWEGYGLMWAIVIALGGVVVGGASVGAVERIEACVERIAGHLTRKQGKTEVIYGDPDDTRYLFGDDRPLPEGLRYRIAIYRGKRTKGDPDALQKEISNASSYNAFVRQELRAGRL